MEAKRQNLIRLLSAAQETASELQENLGTDARFRGEVAQMSKKLSRTIQTPFDEAWELFLRPFHPAVLQVAIDAGWLGLINSCDTADNDTGVTADQLADYTSSDVGLVKRLMRMLTANATIREVGTNEYAPTPFSKLFDTPEWANGLRHSLRDYSITSSGMPAYFSETKYQLYGVQDGIYQYVHGVPFLERVRQGGEVGAQFTSFMGVVRAGKTSWFNAYPVEEKLKVRSNDDVLLVDVGGGSGHDLKEFSHIKKKLQLQGRLVLQDVPAVLGHVSSEDVDTIEVQAHDFFTPQKTRGARAYFLKHVLHDWPNEDCSRILAHVRDAMEPGFSRLLVNEMVIPDKGCDAFTAGFDTAMLAVVTGRERSASDWESLFSATDGLVIEKIWSFGPSNESIIEVVRHA